MSRAATQKPATSLDLPTNALIARYGLDEIRRNVSALFAIEQLLKVPVPHDQDDPTEINSMRHVFRDDLHELLLVVCSSLQEKVESTAVLMQAVVTQTRPPIAQPQAAKKDGRRVA